MKVTLHSLTVENLRGYTRAEFPLDRRLVLLVGKNNSGKTSILKLLAWLINGLDLDAAERGDPLRNGDLDFLLPARETRNRARRLSLCVQIEDARRHRRFQCEDGRCTLRVDVRMKPHPMAVLKLSPPSRHDVTTTEPNAAELLRELRTAITLVHVPSFRDVGSARFLETLTDAFRARLSERALHARRAGAPAEYRTIKSTREELKKVAESLAAPLWDAMRGHIPAGLAKSARVVFDCEAEDLVGWMAERLSMRISTGDHDANSVEMTELGSGLQSILDLAIQKGSSPANGVDLVLALEEPEAFLHPAAQRTLARLVTTAATGSTIITTHSPVIVEEATYGNVVLVRDHQFFVPPSLDDQRRDEINTALMSGFGAELMFARGVLLVEGEGDRQLFEALRRRIARVDVSGRLDDAIVVPVGSKTHFAPWVELVRSYGTAENAAFKWLVAADGDASSEIRDALTRAGVTIPANVRNALTDVRRAESTAGWSAAVNTLNNVCSGDGFPLRLLSVDLESAVLAGASARTRRAIAEKAGWRDLSEGRVSQQDLLHHLGSKGASPHGEGNKAPWLRGYIGQHLPWREVSLEFRAILAAWLATVMPRDEAQALLNLSAIE